ncbi:DUF2280 domain-containing protein [Mesorhizobium sp. 43Arga]
MATAKLPEAAKALVVQRLAAFDSPSDVVEVVKKEFGISVSRQSVEFFDPTKRAGKNLAPKWRAIFEQAREAFLRETATIGISHRVVRLRALQRMADKAEEMGNSEMVLKILRQAAEEVGGMYTSRREYTGLTPAVVAILPKA